MLKFKALILAGLTAGGSLLSVLGLGAELRRRTAVHSHEKPGAETWFEDSTPSSPPIIAEGRKLFLGSCAHCHGADARGDEGPDLHEVAVSDRYIKNTILRGIPHEMPSFAKKLGAPEIASLTAYLRSLD